ncbi:PA2778 family cysteine peptidase [Ectothiorhodospiraceae bacterium WFHF3C12]|nr:PA2778 family cysteine peptidase [Ectothiorhodospiraceae bacterium WFHF3C12]
MLVGGCASPGIQRPAQPLAEIELASVPFHPQSRYQCGPAALATVLGWSGREISPETLKPRVYVPERQGTLQPEVKAAARAEGRLAYPLQRHVDALLAELDAGHPVLVMQNLGLSWLPQWHYAVVVGTAATPARVILRSGRERRRVTPLETFLRTWRRAEHWALVVLPPGRMPATAEPLPYLRAASELEGTAGPEAAIPAYRAGVGRWPDDERLVLALANAQYDNGQRRVAMKTLRDAVEGRHGDSAMLLNNLAMVAAELGRWRAAERALDRGLALGGAHQETLRRTRTEIRCMRSGRAPDGCESR